MAAGSVGETSGFARYTAFAEVCLVFLLGNLIGALIIRLGMSAEYANLASDNEALDLSAAALSSGVQLSVRFGIMMALGFGLLWWRKRLAPRAVGITRNGWPIWKLIVAGIVLYAVATLPLNLLQVLNEFRPMGEGLPIWQKVDGNLGRGDFWLWLLVGTVILPPIYEEIVMRGYIRARLAENFGPMGGVIISAFIFMLAHGHFYATDTFLILSMVCGILAAICWAYVVLRTGSVIPAIVAHMIFNFPKPDTVVIGDQTFSVPIVATAISLAIIIWALKFVTEYAGAFVADLRAADKAGIFMGVLFSIGFLVPIMSFSAAEIPEPVLIFGFMWMISFVIFTGISLHKIRVDRKTTQEM